MTPSEQWILGLCAVYAIPSFLLGVGVTLLVVRWGSLRTAIRTVQGHLSPEQTFERVDLKAGLRTPMGNRNVLRHLQTRLP
jgi:hypothetical protein